MQHEVVAGLMQPGGDPDLLDVLRRPDWIAHAACKGQDPAAFVPAHPMKGETPPPRLLQVCNRCPVAPECLQYALERPELRGCWGGITKRQRKELRRRLAA